MSKDKRTILKKISLALIPVVVPLVKLLIAVNEGDYITITYYAIKTAVTIFKEFKSKKNK
jgi:hypothetical protein